MRRLLVRILAIALALVAGAAGAGYLYLRHSLPTTSGEVLVDNISGPIEIVRDADDIPHIFASTKHDAFYGLGYVHAQDRLWQMEFQRRIGHGRLSEIFGPATIPQDRFLRTVGFGRVAQSAWVHLPEDARGQINAYVAGVNAFIAAHRGPRLPPEFSLLRFEPEPFSGADVLAWVKMMAWDLSGNYSSELMRHDMVARVGAERMAELLPPYPLHGLSILGNADVTDVARAFQARSSHAPAQTELRAETLSAFAHGLSQGLTGITHLLLGWKAEALGSNSWVVDGTLTASGKPLLANDPHLGTQMPSLWYLAHLSAGDFDVIGATLPGTPAVAIGRNRHIAWGETNVAADVEDLFLERVDASGKAAEFRGLQEPLRIIPETIVVKGAEPVHIEVRFSRHGPLISDAINANNAASTTPRPAPIEPLAFQWTALEEEDRTIVAFLRLNEARNWQDFTSALRDFIAPAQNFVYADVHGHIGYYAPGRIPIRGGGDGSRPTPGWTGESEWIGWIPFDELPHTFDPPEHFIVTANHRPAPPAYPYLIALEFPEPYRAQRITDLIRQKSKLTPDDFRLIQADTISLHGQLLGPLLIRHAHPETGADRQALELLQRWDFDARADSAATAIFQAWFLRLAPAIAGDELGPSLTDTYQRRFSYIARFVTYALTAGASPWCDNIATPTRETCDQAVTAALHSAVLDLTERLGSDMSRWRWDAVHRAVFPHQGLDSVGALRPILSRSMPNGGDWSTVNVGPVAVDTPYEQHSIPGYRQIVDLSSANDSRFLDAVGQSGHFLSPHYDDFLSDWQAVGHRRMRMDRTDIEKGALGRLRLRQR
jgi:penicillin G amidase